MKEENTGYAIYAKSDYGPTFGHNHDIYISKNVQTNVPSMPFTNLNKNYQPPSGVSDTTTILAGSYYFSPSEIEVFYSF